MVVHVLPQKVASVSNLCWLSVSIHFNITFQLSNALIDCLLEKPSILTGSKFHLLTIYMWRKQSLIHLSCYLTFENVIVSSCMHDEEVQWFRGDFIAVLRANNFSYIRMWTVRGKVVIKVASKLKRQITKRKYPPPPPPLPRSFHPRHSILCRY